MERATATRIASARTVKATKLACALLLTGADSTTVDRLTPQARVMAEKLAGTRQASDDTWALVATMLQHIEAAVGTELNSQRVHLESLPDPE
jgi:hypothetical protein